MDKSGVLRQYFGYTEFRQGQGELIDAILAGRDVLGVMPTGGGKSLCYQIPALLLDGVTLVISPLISLMKDQVAALCAAGISAAYINSSLSEDQIRRVYSAARSGKYKLLYVAPERLEGSGFFRLASGLNVPFVAVDEAHCISQWGQDFRPSYLHISAFIDSLPRRPVVAAFTATATAQVRHDIERLLELDSPMLTVTGFNRPNLYFDVLRPDDKFSALRKLIDERRDKSGIIYCSTRATVERIEAGLRSHGVSVTRYHAGLSEAERRENQDAFSFDRCSVMVATNAFGMGIDKSNVGYVIHYNMPKSLEAYYQEAGRAGRDGSDADCILLYSPGDVYTARFLIENGGNPELSEETQAIVRRRELERLSAMQDYCRTTACLRGRLLDYFGQHHPESCGNCGNCRGNFKLEDITERAQMALSCVVRIRRRCGFYVGKSLLVQALCGGKSKRLVSLGLDTITTYGLMAGTPAARCGEIVDFLLSEGSLCCNTERSTVEPGPRFREGIDRDAEIIMPFRSEPPKPKKRRGIQPFDIPRSSSLLSALKAERSRLAKEENVPAYIICSNVTLAYMAELLPHTIDELLDIPGIGEKKAARYGEAFLKAIAAYERQA